MSHTASKRRDFSAYVVNTQTSKAMLTSEPRLGRRFGDRIPDIPKARPDGTIKGRLVANLGEDGFARLAEQMKAQAAGPPRRRRRRPRRAPKAVIA